MTSGTAPATEMMVTVVKKKLLLLTVLWKEIRVNLDLSGPRKAQDNHHSHVCASVSVQRCECVSLRKQDPRQKPMCHSLVKR